MFDDHVNVWKKWKKKKYDESRYNQNSEKIKEKVKKWYNENREQRNAHIKKYQVENRVKSKKEYQRKYQRLFRLMNPELVKERNRKCYWKNPELTRKNRMDYYWKNLEHSRQVSREWKKNNMEKIREYSKKYRLINRDKINAYKRGNKPPKIFYPERRSSLENYKKYKQEYDKKYRLKNKEKKKQIDKQYYQKNKEKLYARSKEYTKIHRKLKPEIYLKSHKKTLEKISKPWNMSWLETAAALTMWSKVIRKNKTCEICKCIPKYAHHVLYKKYYPELCLNENNGISLCQRCHWEVHGQNLKGMKPLEPIIDIRQYAWVRAR